VGHFRWAKSLGKRGKPAGPTKRFGAALKLAGIEGVTWNILRHTFASRFVMAEVDLKTVRKRMGHKTIAITARYAHLAPKHRLWALETVVCPGTDPVQSGNFLAPSTK